MTLTIRSVRSGEAALVLGFVRELADYEKLGHEVRATEEMIEAALFGPAPKAFCEIAEWQGVPVGFALWFYSFSTFKGRHGIYLEDLYVQPHMRGQGAGRALLAALAARCRAENLPRLEWSVLDWNTPSIEFYKAHGAELMDGWTTCRVTGDALAALAGTAS